MAALYSTDVGQAAELAARTLEQVKELQRLLGKKTMEGEILKEALEIATGPKKHLLRTLSLPKDVLR